jgi:hypothetical protein
MRRMDAALRSAGFETWARTYPSRRSTISSAAATVADWLADEAAGRPLMAVTHSLGGILVRHMRDPRLNWQRIAMLAPPNQGSHLAARLRESGLFRWFYGPAGVELADPSGWPLPPAPFMVVAGTRRLALVNPTSWTAAAAFPEGEPHDGTVAVSETKLAGMSGLVTVDATHTWIMNDARAQEAVIRFLGGAAAATDAVSAAPRG